MREFKSIKQMQRLAKTAGDISVKKAQANLELARKARESDIKKERALKSRIAEEQAKFKYSDVRKENPLKFRAFVELERLFNTGKKGFLWHLTETFLKDRKVVDSPSDQKLFCAITRTRLRTEGEVSEEGLKHSLAYGSTDSDVYLCDEAIQALEVFANPKISSGELRPPQNKKGSK